MCGETITHKRLWAWLTVAMSAPLAHFSGGSWLGLLALEAACLGVCGLLPRGVQDVKNSRIVCCVEVVWTAVLLSQLIPASAGYWPGEKSEIIIPTALLALGAYSCGKRPSRVAGVLFGVLVIMYIPVVAAGVKDVELRWLVPKSMAVSVWLVPVLLLPATGRFLTGADDGGKWNFGILLFGVALWMLTTGVLSPAVEEQVQTPFRELSRSLTIGAASRFESLISVVVTLGWFALASYLIHCGAHFGEGLGVSKNLSSWLIALASFLMLLWDVRIKPEIAAGFAAFAWIILPVLWSKKTWKKREKSA